MAKYGVIKTNDGLEAWIEYNPSNLRASQVGWVNSGPNYYSYEVNINTLTFTGVIPPGGSGLQNLGGNFRLTSRVIVEEDGNTITQLLLPDGVSYRIGSM